MLRFDFNVIFTIINLFVLYFLMKKFLFDKVNNIIQQRQQMVDEEYAAAQAAREQAQADQAKYSAALAQADQEVDGILKEGREKARVEYNRVLANAQAEAQKEVAKAHASIARDREETMRSIKTEVGQLVALTAGKLLEEDVSDEVCERLYEEMMAQAGERE